MQGQLDQLCNKSAKSMTLNVMAVECGDSIISFIYYIIISSSGKQI